MSKYLTPLRYPGGKAKFIPAIESIIKENDAVGCDYLEPFAGGAAVALYLLMNKICSNIHINDLDEAIYSFWKAVLTEPEDFIRKIEKTPVTMKRWQQQKKILNSSNPSKYSLLERGFATFFLNRTNHSGILKAGAIGGQEQKGKYKIDARFNKKDLIKRIDRIADHKDNIYLYGIDAQHLLRDTDNFLPSDSLIYLDPPYYLKGQGLYRNFYEHKDHVIIKEILSDLKFKWVVSYDKQPEIEDIYKNFRQGEYSLNYSVSNLNRRQATEIIIASNNLKIPNIDTLTF